MASIQRTVRETKKGKKVYFYLQYKNDENKWTKQLLKGTTTWEEANKRLALYNAKEINQSSGGPVRKIDITIQEATIEFIETFLKQESIRGVDRRSGTIRVNVYEMLVIKKWFAYKKINRFDKITDTHINSLKNDLNRKPFNYKLSTIREYQKMFTKFLKWCNEKYYFQNINLIKKYRLVDLEDVKAEKQKRFRDNGLKSIDEVLFYSKKEIEIIFNEINPYDKDLLLFVYKTGRRINEAITLRWYEYSRENKIISLSVMELRKNKKQIDYPLSNDAIEIIERQPKINDYIFNNKYKRPFVYGTVKHNLTTVLKKHDIKFKKIHTLRHTFASELMENNVHTKVIQKLLGHSSDYMTNIYTHATDKSLFDAVNSLNKNRDN